MLLPWFVQSQIPSKIFCAKKKEQLNCNGGCLTTQRLPALVVAMVHITQVPQKIFQRTTVTLKFLLLWRPGPALMREKRICTKSHGASGERRCPTLSVKQQPCMLYIFIILEIWKFDMQNPKAVDWKLSIQTKPMALSGPCGSSWSTSYQSRLSVK